MLDWFPLHHIRREVVAGGVGFRGGWPKSRPNRKVLAHVSFGVAQNSWRLPRTLYVVLFRVYSEYIILKYVLPIFRVFGADVVRNIDYIPRRRKVQFFAGTQKRNDRLPQN